jgi:hypothetical protein
VSLELDLAECAKINFENLERAFPLIKEHPFYLIAKAQLDESLGYQTVEESLEKYKMQYPSPPAEPSSIKK